MQWIIGDIHGMLRPLEALLEAVARVDPEAELIFLGDYVNRGPDSFGVVQRLLELPHAVFLRGNHDDIFDEILHGRGYAHNVSMGRRLIAYKWFMQYGLDSTLVSYGVDLADMEWLLEHPSEEGLDRLLECVPEAHRQFIHHLQPVLEDKEFFVVHGKWDVDEPDLSPTLAQRLNHDPSLRENLLWGRFVGDELTRLKAWHRTGYFGHTAVENYPRLLPNGEYVPIHAPKLVLLETGVALSPQGRLTAFCHQTQSYLQADHFGKMVTSEPRAIRTIG